MALVSAAYDAFVLNCRAAGMSDRTIWTLILSCARTGSMVAVTVFFTFVVPLIPGSKRWKLDHGVPKESRKLVMKAFQSSCINHAIVYPFVAWLLYPARALVEMEPGGVPGGWTIAWQIVVSILLEDFGFYWCHRLLHQDFLYGYVHKQHHQFHANVPIAAEYFHPVEDVLNILPTLLGPILLRMHLGTLALWVMIRISEIVDAHSGYSLPFSPWDLLLRIQGGADRHEYHHSHNKGCYGSFTKFWDWVAGTDVEYNEWRAKRLAEKMQGGGKKTD